MVTYSQLVTQFPEFAATDANLVQAMLDAAYLEIDQSVWGNLADQGQMYCAADMLATSPFGQNVRLVADGVKGGGGGHSTYWTRYQALIAKVASGYRVC
jgi:hypothetical protein